MRKLKIIKIGGQVIDNAEELNQFLPIFASLEDPKILVHGGGKLATFYSERMQIKPNLVDGRRITDRDTIDVVQMVYGGLINKNIVAALQKYKCKALGLSGADLDSIQAIKRPVKSIDYGYVGDVVGVNTTAIMSLLEAGIIPVFCALTHDGEGQMLNTNADTIATELGSALSKLYKVEMIFCFEKKGVLKDLEDETTLIPRITPDFYNQLKRDGAIVSGMIPKIDNAFRALNGGVRNVHIISYKDLEDCSVSGTKIVL
jgi:acetylglutamate kinase